MVGIVVAVAVALRWGFVASAQILSPLRADAGQYALYAKNLVEHGVYSLATSAPPAPDSFRSPGYPFVLAICRLLGGEGGWQTVAVVLQVVLGSLTVLLAYRLARSFLPFAPSLAAAALCALSPHLVVSCGYVLTECVTTFAVVAGLWLCADVQSRWRCTAAALTLGAAVLCNESFVFLPFVVAFGLRRMGTRRTGAFLLLALAPFSLWALRNQTTTLARTGGERAIASISHGSYPGMVFHDPRLVGYPYHEDPEQPAFGSSWAKLREVLGARVAADPVRYVVWYALEKPLWLWRWDLVQGRDVQVYDVANSPYERQAVVMGTHWLMRWLHVPVMLLAAVGALVSAWNRGGRSVGTPQVLGLVAVFGTLAYLPVIPDPRYLQPIRPVLFVLAGCAAAAVWQVASTWRRAVGAESAPSTHIA